MKKLLFAAVILTLVSAAVSGASRQRPSRWDEQARGRKAEYIYTSALERRLDTKEDEYFSLLEYASELDPSDLYLSGYLGFSMFMLPDHHEDRYTTALEMMQRTFDGMPADKNFGDLYLAINRLFNGDATSIPIARTMHYRFPNDREMTRTYIELLGEGDTADVAMAFCLLDSLEAVEGMSTELSTYKIALMFSRNDTLGPFNEINRLIASNPASSEYTLLGARLYSAMERPDTARLYLQRAVELDSTNILARYMLAEDMLTRGDSVAYDREIFSLVNLDEIEPEGKVEIIRGYVMNLFTDSVAAPRIERMFSNILESYPLDADLRMLYGLYLSGIEDFDSAIEQFEIATDLNPGDIKQWQSLIGALLSVEDYEEAAEVSGRALRLFPDDTQLMLTRASMLMHIDARENFDEGMALLAKVDSISLANNDLRMASDARGVIGDAYMQLEEPQNSFKAYEQALSLWPDNYMIANNYAYYLALEGENLDLALTLIEKVIDSNEPNPTWLDTYAWVLFKRKDYAAARGVIDQALDLTEAEDMSSDILDHAGDIYFMDGEPERALQFWKDALELDPENDLIRKKVTHKTFFYE